MGLVIKESVAYVCGINYTIVILHALIEYWKDPFKVNLPGIWWTALIWIII